MRNPSPCTSAAVRSSRADCDTLAREARLRRRITRAKIALFAAQLVFTVAALACPVILLLVGNGLASGSLSEIGGGVALFGAVFIARALVVLVADHLERLDDELRRVRC